MSAGRAARVEAMFGIDAAHDRGSAGAEAAARTAARLDRALAQGGVALVTGPSGGGKSSILRALERRLARLGRPMVRCDGDRVDGARAAVEQIGGRLETALSIAASAGLAEAWVLVRRADRLSAGERARLELAMAMDVAARAGATLLVDEFASVLDRTTAAGVARSVARWARRAGRVRVVCATAHDDALEWLAPDVLVWQGLGERARVMRARG